MRRIAGSPRPQVLIITNELDVSADWVVRELRRRSVQFLRLNTERFPSMEVVVDPIAGQWILRRDQVTSDLSAVKSVWYRRPEPPDRTRLASLTDGEFTVAVDQWRAAVGSLALLPEARWMNRPERNVAAESKAVQIRLASALGFAIPETRITNSRREATTLFRRHDGAVVIKALHAPLVGAPDGSSFIYTERLAAENLKRAAAVEPVPFIIQQQIDPKTDVRVTVVGDQVFPAAIAEPLTTIDWRIEKPSKRFAPHALPDEVAERCRLLVAKLGLRFGAIDLLLSPSGEYFFLEVNPNGEWGWLNRAGLPIAAAITDWRSG